MLLCHWYWCQTVTLALVLVLDSWHNGINAPSIRSLVEDEG